MCHAWLLRTHALHVLLWPFAIFYDCFSPKLTSIFQNPKYFEHFFTSTRMMHFLKNFTVIANHPSIAKWYSKQRIFFVWLNIEEMLKRFFTVWLILQVPNWIRDSYKHPCGKEPSHRDLLKSIAWCEREQGNALPPKETSTHLASSEEQDLVSYYFLFRILLQEI